MRNLPINIYLGGSFDPIHNGHIAMLKHVYQQLHLSKMDKVNAQFLPNSRSPLKQACTNPKHRFTMLSLAARDLNSVDLLSNTALVSKNAQSIFSICEQEIWQLLPNYTIDTLKELRHKYPSISLIFILGADSIANLAQWRHGEQLTKFAHLWVLPRDKWQSKSELYQLLPTSLQSTVTQTIGDLKSLTHGRIYIDSKSIDPISSSDIRQSLINHQFSKAKSALPSSVYSYIIKHNLYQSP